MNEARGRAIERAPFPRTVSIPQAAPLILCACAALVLAAFWPQYLSRPFPAVDRYTHFHAAAGSLWYALLVVQPAAISLHRYTLHRTLGRASYLLAPLFALSAILLSHYRLVSMDAETFAAEGFTAYLPMFSSIVFILAYGLGLRYRSLAAVHGRFMLLTTIPLVDPVVGRVMFFYGPALGPDDVYHAITFTLATAIAGVLVFSYRSRPRPRRALVGFFCVLVLLELGWFTVARTSDWLGIVRRFRDLPLP
jgi:hypothetical protein